MLTLTLPFPPTINNYWRSPPGQHVMLSREGRAYRTTVAEAVMLQRVKRRPEIFDARLSVRVEAYPPRHGRRDLDNLLKALLDAMQHANIYQDDSQIDYLAIERRAVTPPGFVVVQIEAIESTVETVG